MMSHIGKKANRILSKHHGELILEEEHEEFLKYLE